MAIAREFRYRPYRLRPVRPGTPGRNGGGCGAQIPRASGTGRLHAGEAAGRRAFGTGKGGSSPVQAAYGDERDSDDHGTVIGEETGEEPWRREGGEPFRVVNARRGGAGIVGIVSGERFPGMVRQDTRHR